jgi:hypothetical protein
VARLRLLPPPARLAATTTPPQVVVGSMANVQFFSHLVVAQHPRYKILPIHLITFRTMTHPLQCIAALQVENRLCTLQKTLLPSFLCFSFESFETLYSKASSVAMTIIFILIALFLHVVASQNTAYRADGRCGSGFGNAPCDPLLSGACCSING